MTCFFGEISFTLNKHSRFEFWKRVKGDKEIKMSKRILFSFVLLVSLLVPACIISGEPKLLSIRFIDDKTLEYEFARLQVNENTEFEISYFSITPDDGYRILYESGTDFGTLKRRAYFNKDIPDGTKIDLTFCYSSSKEYALSYSFVKGETSEE